MQEHQVWDVTSLVVTVVTFPLCLLPVRTLFQEYRSSAQTRDQHRKHLGLLSLWITITISHLVLISYPIVGIFEQTCDDRLPASWDTLDELRRCKRNYIGAVVESIEVLTLPVYPVLMVSTYIQLLPTNTRKWVVSVARLVKWSLAGLTLTYFVAISAQRLIYFTAEYPYGLSSASPSEWAEFYFWTIEMPTYIFTTWFFSLVAVGLLALALTVRLLPFLAVSQPSSRTTTPYHSIGPAGHQSSSSSGGGASTTKRESSALVRFGRKSQEMLTSATKAATTPPSSSAAERVQACVRRLKTLIGVMALTLVLSTLMVVLDWFPRVLYVTIGWVCGRALTVALFVATREIKSAVMARRMVPANAVGVTLAATAWSGHGGIGPVGLATQDVDEGQGLTILPSRSVSVVNNGLHRPIPIPIPI